jgi:hypothetical protein
LCADTNRVGLGCSASIADIDIVIAGGEIRASIRAHSYVTVSCCVDRERIKSLGSVTRTRSVIEERAFAIRSITPAGGVRDQRKKTSRCIIAPVIFDANASARVAVLKLAAGIVQESINPISHIIRSAAINVQCSKPRSAIATSIVVALEGAGSNRSIAVGGII